MRSIARRVRAVPNIAVGVIAGLLIGGGSFAIAAEVGTHGGPKPRFHDAGECNLVDVSKLPGNWTHGDYVSAVEKKDPSKVREAAHSRCGKPAHAGKGNKQKKDKEPKDRAEKSSAPSPKPAKPSPKPTSPKRGPTATPSATGSASPVVPLSPSPSVSPS